MPFCPDLHQRKARGIYFSDREKLITSQLQDKEVLKNRDRLFILRLWPPGLKKLRRCQAGFFG
jgi:hypothetical protein